MIKSYIRRIDSDALFLVILVLVFFAMGIPRLEMPGFWDEPKVYLKPLFSLFDNFWGYFQAPLTNTHRPPGIHFLYLPFLWIFGPSISIIRFLNLIYFSAGLVLLYKVLSQENKFLAKLSLSFVALTPIFQVYSVQYVGEPQLMTFFSLYLYLLSFHRRKSLLIFVTGIYLGFCRETSLALIPAVSVMFFLEGNKKSAYLPLLGPLLGCILYWSFTYEKTGSLFSHLTIDQGHIDLLRDPFFRCINIFNILIVPYRLLPLLMFSFCAFILNKNCKRPRPLTGFLIVLALAYLFVFSSHKLAIPRYYYSVFPFFVFLLLIPVKNILRTQGPKLFILLVVLLPPFFMNPIVKIPGPFGYQDTWDHAELARLHQKVLADIKSNHPGGTVIMTSWPFLEMFKLNYSGYGKPLDYRYILDLTAGHFPDVLLFTDYPQQLREEDLKAIVQSGRFREKKISFKDYHLRIFEKIAPR